MMCGAGMRVWKFVSVVCNDLKTRVGVLVILLLVYGYIHGVR